jgi:serine protease inhibitor
MKKLIFGYFLAAATLIMGSCNNTAPGVQSVDISANFATKTTDFAFDFWKKLEANESPDKNYFVSPLSLHLALGMLLNGADTETKAEIQQVLGLENQSIEEINATYKELIDKLPLIDAKVVNKIANSVWQHKSFMSNKEFTDNLTKKFNARLYSEDFADPNTVNKINQWASDNTNAKIKQILDQIDPNEVMFLINALYFKGDWSKQFKKENTQKEQFYGSKTTKTVDMMNQTEAFEYADLENYKIVKLPYGNEKYSMSVVLPKSQSLETVIQKINSETWQTAQNSLSKTTVAVGLPKFEMEYSKKLNTILNQMGMVRAFEDNADLSKIAKPGGKLKVGFVKQDTFISVDEKGTEAAAVTSIGIKTTSVIMNPEVICNKPFAFVISEKTSNTILFIGKISNL